MRLNFKLFLLMYPFMGNHHVMSQPSPPFSFNLTDLVDGVSGVSYNGTFTREFAGHPVSSGGDVNGDGLDDFIIGNGEETIIYVVFGSNNTSIFSSFSLNELNGTNGFTLNLPPKPSTRGLSAASGCDVNHDGIDDLIIGAPGAYPNGLKRAGQVYVVFGNTSWAPSFNISVDSDGTNGYTINGFFEEDEFGDSVSCGDVNGDGIDDVVVSARGIPPRGLSDADDDEGEERSGRVYVFLGSTELVSSPFNLTKLEETNRGYVVLNDINGTLGGTTPVSAGGDVNGDAVKDIVIGDMRLGQVHCPFGSNTTWSSPFNLSNLNDTTGFTFDGVGALPDMTIASDGDFNGDHIDDIVIGLPSKGKDGEGEVIVVFGTNGTWVSQFLVSALNSTNGFVIPGIDAEGAAGASVALGGDTNADGIDDLIIGVPFAGGFGTSRGKVYIVFGSSVPWALNFSLSDLDGANGFALNGIADFDRADPNGTDNAGQAYVVFGVESPSTSQSPTTTPLPSSLPTTAAPTTTSVPSTFPTTQPPTTTTPLPSSLPTTKGPSPPSPLPTTAEEQRDTEPPTTDEECHLKSCCEAECCGRGTSWSFTRGCYRNASSTGWEGSVLPEHQGCAVRVCCEGDCCGWGTHYNAGKAECKPN